MKTLFSVSFWVYFGGCVICAVVVLRTKESTHLIEKLIHEIGHLHQNHLKLQEGRESLIRNVERVENVMKIQQGIYYKIINNLSLTTTEKFEIVTNQSTRILNKRNEIANSCRHRAKFKLKQLK